MNKAIVCYHGKSKTRWTGGQPTQAYLLAKYLKCKIYTKGDKNPYFPDDDMDVKVTKTILFSMMSICKNNDVVYIFGMASKKSLLFILLLKILTGTKIIFHLTDENASRLIKFVADKIIVSSKYLLEKYKIKKAVYIPPLIHKDYFEMKPSGKGTLILNQLTLNDEYSEICSYLMANISDLPKPILLISRYGEKNKDVFLRRKDIIKRIFKINVKGWVNVKEEIKKKAVIVYINHSISKRMKPPLSVLEGMAAGRICIVLPNNGLDDYLRFGENYVFPNNYVKYVPKRIGTNARKSIIQCHPDKVIKKYERVIGTMTSSPH